MQVNVYRRYTERTPVWEYVDQFEVSSALVTTRQDELIAQYSDQYLYDESPGAEVIFVGDNKIILTAAVVREKKLIPRMSIGQGRIARRDASSS